MLRIVQVFRLLLTTIVCSALTGCGGSADQQRTITPDGTLDQIPDSLVDLSDLGDLGDLANLGDLTNPNGLVTDFQTPVVRTLNWPRDFPADIRAGLSDTVLVNGMPARAAYDFDVTLPPSVDSEHTTLFVMNLSEDQQVGGQVCNGDPDCTGTVNYKIVSLQLVSFDTGTASISIEPSSTPALVNQGSSSEPVVLTANGDQLSYEGTVGAAMQTQQQIIQGQSFYQLTGLTSGDRYEIRLTSTSDSGVAMTAGYAGGADARCDPSYSATSRCVLVAGAAALDLQVEGDFALFGASYTIDVRRLATGSDFEGTWHTPITLPVPTEALTYHFGQADKYSSYYRLTDLNPERQYRIQLSGTTTPAYLKLNSPTTSLPLGGSQCRATGESNSATEQVCIIDGAIKVDFRIEALAESSTEPSHYLLSIEASLSDEGSPAIPLSLQLNDQSRLLHTGTVNTSSYYRVEHLTIGQTYLLQTYAPTGRQDLSVSTPSSDEVDCNGSFHSDCVFTANDSRLNVTVTDGDSDLGQRYVLSIVPTDPSSTVYPAPANENTALHQAVLPYTGIVGSHFSNYTVTGLEPDQRYLAIINHNSRNMSFSAWPGSARTISCVTQAYQPFGTGCSSHADSDGIINIRVGGGDSGGQFTIDLLRAQSGADYQSNDTPLDIPDNSAPGAISTIFISENRLAEIIEVELQIEHGYTEDLEIILEAPDGRRVMLADHLAGEDFGQTLYSDLAALSNNTDEVFGTHVLRTYRPDSLLHRLAGMNVSGNWRLHVTDDRYSNRSDALGGTLLGWGLNFRQLPE